MSYVRDLLNTELSRLQEAQNKMRKERDLLTTSIEMNQSAQDAIEYVLNGENIK